MRRLLLTLAVVVLVPAPAAVAQTPVPPQRPKDIPPVEAPKDRDDNPPYEAKLERLAELMGTLALLRDLCPPGDGATWRTKMEELLASEGSAPARRDRLAGAFNRGFGGYRLTYRSCTPAAELVIDRALDEGGRLARDISARFTQ